MRREGCEEGAVAGLAAGAGSGEAWLSGCKGEAGLRKGSRTGTASDCPPGLEAGLGCAGAIVPACCGLLHLLLSFLGTEPPYLGGDLEAAGRAGPPSAHLQPCPAHLWPPLDSLRAGLMTQLAAPGHPRPIPYHLQPASARNSLGLLPSTGGLQPRALPQPSGPCPCPAEAPRGWRAASEDRWGDQQGGAVLFSAEDPCCPGASHPCLVSTSASWSPRSVGPLLTPLYLASLLHLCLLVSPNRAFGVAAGDWGGN